MSGEQPNMFVLRTAEHVRFFVTAVKIVDSMAHADVVAWLRRWICSHNFALLVRLIHLRRQRPKAKAIPTRERVPNGGPLLTRPNTRTNGLRPCSVNRRETKVLSPYTVHEHNNTWCCEHPGTAQDGARCVHHHILSKCEIRGFRISHWL